MNTRTAIILCILLTVALGIYNAWLYPGLPETIPTHWGISGKPDGWGSKSIALLMMPGAMVILTGLFLLLPWLSPKNFKIDSFRGTYNYIFVLVVALMGYIGLMMVLAVTHPEINGVKPMIGGILIFIGLMGNLMGKVQRNFYVGIRTPWTLASDKVWVATHRLGARLMFGSGILGALLIFLGVPIMPVFLVFLVACLYPVLYSFVLYKKLERSGAV